MDRIGTDETLLTRVLVSQRHVAGRFKEIEQAWLAAPTQPVRPAPKEEAGAQGAAAKDRKPRPEKPLRQWIHDETSGDYRETLLQIWDNFGAATTGAAAPAEKKEAAKV